MMVLRKRVFVVVLRVTTDDSQFSDPNDLSEVATVLEAAIARGVTALHDLTLYEIFNRDVPHSSVWAELRAEAHRQVLTKEVVLLDVSDPTVQPLLLQARQVYQQALLPSDIPTLQDIHLIEGLKHLEKIERQLAALPLLENSAIISSARAQILQWANDLTQLFMS